MTKLYLISPPQIHLNNFTNQLLSIIDDEKIGAFQLRLKDTPTSEITAAIKLLLPICHDHGVPFFINDFYQLARDYDIDGIHVGQGDCSLPEIIKEFSKEKIIGVSCQNSKHLAMTAGNEGADYVSFGAFFPTQTKKNTVRADTDIIDWWLKYTNIPCAAIGGINHKNISEISQTKPDFICLISAIWNHELSPKEAIKKIKL